MRACLDHRLVAASIALVALLGPAVLTACAGSDTSARGVVVVPEERAVDFPAQVHAAAWDGGEMAGYHLVVWRGGGSAESALFRAAVSDAEVLDALESLGAVPGDTLDIGTWDERDDPSSWKPDQVIQGPAVEILVRAASGGPWLGLDQVVEDPMGVGFDMRLGGHRANIPAWKSGCVVCLYSCPGGKVGNARYTVRDFAKKTTRFAVRDGVLPEDGERVTLRIRLIQPA